MKQEAHLLQEMLQKLYSRHQGWVGFVDESYRARSDADFAFYIAIATVLDIKKIAEYREAYYSTAGGAWWHTTDVYRDGDRQRIKDFIHVLAGHESKFVISVQIEIGNDSLEHARRECLVQLVSKLSQLGCDLVVYERREDGKARNADAALFSRAKRDGFLSRNTVVFAGSPSIERLLWGPDLIGWAMRRYLAIGEPQWIGPVARKCDVIDISVARKLKEKGPEPAAAMDPDPDSSVGQKDEGKNRSSHGSMPQKYSFEKDIFALFHSQSEPNHDPGTLKMWLQREFPHP